MEEKKKRKGYKTKEQQNEATRRYRATEKGKATSKHSTYKSRARIFIKELANQEELNEFKSLINERFEELKGKN